MAKYIGLAIKPYNDLEVTADGDLRLVTDAEAIGQHTRQRISFFKGEWFLDLDVGLDWFGKVLGGSSARIPVMEAMVKETILATPGVTDIVEISLRHDRASRGAIVTRCEVETEFNS